MDNLYDLSDLPLLENKDTFNSVCVVKDFFTKESQAGNKYMKILEKQTCDLDRSCLLMVLKILNSVIL